MPNRILREEILRSDRWLGLAHPAERLAFLVLVLNADDLGTLEASDGALVRLWRDPCNVKGREDAVRILSALADCDLVRPYEVQAKRYLFLPRTKQRFRAKSLLHPAPPESLLDGEDETKENIKQIKARIAGMPDVRQTRDRHMSDARLTRAPVVVVEDEDVIKKGAASAARPRVRFTPPTLAEVRDYVTLKGYHVDPERWLAHYESNGWRVGKNPMVSWKAAVVTWARSRLNEIHHGLPAKAELPKL